VKDRFYAISDVRFWDNARYVEVGGAGFFRVQGWHPGLYIAKANN
jgi:hypothetical protein